jgi:hypothetical protein
MLRAELFAKNEMSYELSLWSEVGKIHRRCYSGSFSVSSFFLRAVLASAVGHNPLIRPRHSIGNSVLDGVVRYQHPALDVA